MLDRIFSFFDWIVSAIAQIYESIFGSLYTIFTYAFQEIVEELVKFLHWIPVPSFLSSAANNLQAIPPGVSWFLGLMEFNEGLAMIMFAYALRFIVRRIPFIG